MSNDPTRESGDAKNPGSWRLWTVALATSVVTTFVGIFAEGTRNALVDLITDKTHALMRADRVPRGEIDETGSINRDEPPSAPLASTPRVHAPPASVVSKEAPKKPPARRKEPVPFEQQSPFARLGGAIDELLGFKDYGKPK